MIQGNKVVTTATAIFATRRETWQETEKTLPSFPADAPLFDPYMLPPWAKNYRFRFAYGMDKIFQTDAPSSETLQAMRDEPPRPLDFVSLTALSDIFAPRIFIRRPKVVPIGTISLTIYFHADSTMLDQIGEDEVIGQARGNRFYNRYFDQSAEIWNQQGDLIATTTQMVYFKE